MSSSPFQSDKALFIKSWDSTPFRTDPYDHLIVKNFFDASLVSDVVEIPVQEYDLAYVKGTREEFNPTRQYFTPSFISQFDAAQRVADIFRSSEVISAIEKKGNISLKDSLLRIEYAIDKDKFWLTPHTDLGVKLFTFLIYLSKEEDASGWGTDIYYDAETHHSTVPYESNTGLSFFPSDKTWHGFEPRPIKGIRKTLIVNYVTQEWRNRHELVHPTEPMY
ncbi:MAG: 2OG-Fe(II) oxygenase [Proteobacteria bacterium]|nr:2OG-Fe(II) oxygenase [Pseudomonadota bacterium]